MQYMIRSLIYSEFENMDYLRECFREFKIVEDKTYRMIQIEVNSRYNPVNIPLLEQQVDSLFSSIKNGLYVYNYPKLFIGLVEAEEFTKMKKTCRWPPLHKNCSYIRTLFSSV